MIPARLGETAVASLNVLNGYRGSPLTTQISQPLNVGTVRFERSRRSGLYYKAGARKRGKKWAEPMPVRRFEGRGK